MPRFNTIQTSFLAGEISPRAQGRVDLKEYAQGGNEILNAIVHPQGGGSRRVGSQYKAKALDGVTISANSRIFDFVISESVAFVVTVMATQTYLKITDAYAGTHSTRTLLSSSPGYLATATTFAGYSAAQLLDVQCQQVGRYLVFTHPNVVPMILEYNSSGIFSWAPFWYYGISNLASRYLGCEWPFTQDNTTTLSTVTPSAVTVNTTITLTASFAIFNANMVGSAMRITNSGATGTGIVLISGFTSSTQVSAYVIRALVDTVATSLWAFSYWSNSSGWPKTCCFHEQRLFYANNAAYPETLWGSQIGDIFELSDRPIQGATAYGNADPFALTINRGGEINDIQWMVPGKNLTVGTSKRELVFDSGESAMGSANAPIISLETTHGSSGVKARRVHNTVLFIQRSGKKVREFIYDFQENAYYSNDLTYLAEHMPKKMLAHRATYSQPKILEMAHQEADNGITWFIDANGGLFGMTRDRTKEVVAWHWHKMAGDLAGEPPKVKSMCVIPSSDGTHDDLWLLVQRTVNGSATMFMEKIGREFVYKDLYNSATTLDEKPCYMDCAILVSGAATATITGLSHLESETVVILGDGNYLGEFTVTGGQVVLSYGTYSEFIVGLNYRSRLETLNLEAGSAVGVSQGAIRKVDRVSMRFERTIGAKFGRDDDSLEEINWRPQSTDPADPTPMFTGEKHVTFPGNYDREAKVVIVQDYPLPMTVTALTVRGMTND